MGSAFYIVLNTETPGFDLFIPGKSLARNSDALHQIALAVGVKPLWEFFSTTLTDAANAMGLSLEEAEEWAKESRANGGNPPGLEPDWFAPIEGLKTVRALRKQIATSPDTVSNTEDVLFDLTEFERVLSAAEAHSLKWHLAVDY